MSQFLKYNKRSFLDKLSTIYYRKVCDSHATAKFDFMVSLMRFRTNIHVASDAYIKSRARICVCNPDAHINIGNRTTIGYDTKLFASEKISIGDDCMIAPNVYIVDSDHGTHIGQPMNQQANSTNPVIIGNDVWIGAGAVILKGSHIMDGAIIASNSVVKTIVGKNMIYGGVPAKEIGTRT